MQDAENDLVYRLHDSLQRLEAAVEHIDARVKDLEGVVVPIRNYLEASKEGAAAGENANQTVDVDAQLKLVEASGIWFTANSEQVAEPEVVVQGQLVEDEKVAENGSHQSVLASPLERSTDHGSRSAQEHYVLSHSTWDLSMLIGAGVLGNCGSLQAILLVVVSVAMHVVFIGVAFVNFTNPDFTDDTEREIRRWRQSAGHSMAHYTDMSKASLVARVCQLDRSLHESGLQLNLNENLQKYLLPTAEGLQAFFGGQALCLVAITTWYLMLAKELQHATALHRAMICAPRGPTQIVAREDPTEQVRCTRLAAVSWRRKLMSWAILGYRCIVATLLAYVGTNFLVYEISITELMLNAVALGIVLELDELLFDGLAPVAGKTAVRQMEPVPLQPTPQWQGADIQSVSLSLLIPSTLVLVSLVLMAPFVAILKNVSVAMCGGQRDFVWAFDSRNVVLMAPTTNNGWDSSYSIEFAAVAEAEQLPRMDSSRLDDPSASQYGIWVPNVNALGAGLAPAILERIDALNPGCRDMDEEAPMLNKLRYTLENFSVRSCNDAKPFCKSITLMPGWGADGGKGYVTRMICPYTCGCHDPGGLPDNEASLPSRSDAHSLAEALRDYGCNALQKLQDREIEVGTCFEWRTDDVRWAWKTLAHFCPRSCGCKEQGARGACPRPEGRHCGNLDLCVLGPGRRHYCAENHLPSLGGRIAFDANLVASFFPGPIVQVNEDWTLPQSFEMAVKQLVAELVGQEVDPGIVAVSVDEPPFENELLVLFRVVDISSAQYEQGHFDEEAMLQSFQSHPAPEMSTAFDIIAAALNNDGSERRSVATRQAEKTRNVEDPAAVVTEDGEDDAAVDGDEEGEDSYGYEGGGSSQDSGDAQTTEHEGGEHQDADAAEDRLTEQDQQAEGEDGSHSLPGHAWVKRAVVEIYK